MPRIEPLCRRFACFIFDLDGTIIDSASDILDTIRAAFQEAGLPVPALKTGIVGPLLEDIFRRLHPQGSAETIDWLVRLYRARYRVSDFPGSVPYAGVPALWQTLRAKGCRLYLATNKPALMAERLLTRRGLFAALDGMANSDSVPGETLSKAGMIQRLIRSQCLDPGRVLMVGDTPLDMEGGRAAGVATLAALYGYGDKQALLACKPDYVAEDAGWTRLYALPGGAAVSVD